MVDDIAETTGKQIDVLVATHEHWDHVSGFDPSKKRFDSFTIGEVWLAWTEDPQNAIANGLRKERSQKLAALWLGVHEMRLRLGADVDALDDLARSAEVLSFFGIDPSEAPPAGGFGAAADAAGGGKTAAAMKWVRDVTDKPKFRSPGDLIDLPDVDGVRVYVLGPPTDRTQLFKDLPTAKGKETYDDPAIRSLAARAFAAAFAGAGMSRAEFDAAFPFDTKYQIEPAEAQTLDFFRAHYPAADTDDPEPWRRIDSEWLAGAAEFALQLDSDTNNTSLALAFELPDGRVLLFPADAQVGNWESWHVDGAGKKRTWKVNGTDVTAEALLNRTVLYKTGHHGSHNATLRDQGLEMMTDKTLAAMVPVDDYIAHEKKRWKQMPFVPLMARLKTKTQGRILKVDEPLSTLDKNLTDFLAQVTDAEKQIEVAGPNDTTLKRPLYVEYTLPLRTTNTIGK